MRGGRFIQRDIDQAARIHLDHHAIQIPICGIHGIRRCFLCRLTCFFKRFLERCDQIIRIRAHIHLLRRFDQPLQLLDGRKHLVAIDTDLAERDIAVRNNAHIAGIDTEIIYADDAVLCISAQCSLCFVPLAAILAE